MLEKIKHNDIYKISKNFKNKMEKAVKKLFQH